MPQTKLEAFRNEGLFSRHFLEERISEFDEWDCDDEARAAFETLKERFLRKRNLESDNEKELQRELIEPVLKELGHVFAVEETMDDGKQPDFAFFASEDEKQEAKTDDEVFETARIVGDAKRWNISLDQDIEGEPRFDNKNPSFQLYYYLTNTDADWGILTNGKVWRLFYTGDAKVDRYYEVDLENLLTGNYDEEFKYFYCFFRHQAFYPETGTPFLERVHTQSVEFAKELEDNLQERVYDALKYTIEGFLRAPQNDLDEDDLEEVHENALTFLYRLLFVLYAESRDLLPHDNDVYKKQHSLAFRISQLEEGEDNVYVGDFMWRHLSSLFETINEGREVPSRDFHIPAYNGGLFDPEESPFLEEHLINGPYLREIIERLALARDEEGNEVRLDYKDLDIRHLGSIYEGLLEYQPDVASERMVVDDGEWVPVEESSKAFEDVEEGNRVEAGKVYLETDEGERKATGSYYTPQYIVEYIVENTVGPVVEEKVDAAEESDADPAEKILELNVCDPAMGSGHFLVETVSYLATHLLEHTEEMTEDEDAFQEAKRRVVKHCVYGVDVNPMATQLAKLSLWLETAAKDRPLSFLDHHLKTGNSLIGSGIDELDTHPTDDPEREEESSWFQVDIEEIKRDLRDRYQDIEDMPEETINQIKEKEEAYEAFVREHVVYNNLKELADLHTYQYFEQNRSYEQYSNISKKVAEPQTWQQFHDADWFQTAEKHANREQYFHWPLEFPDVFFSERDGFDAVVGNPPYVRQEQLKDAKPVFERTYRTYTSTADLYVYFIEKGVNLLHPGGEFGYIVSNKFMRSDYGQKLRTLLTTEVDLQQLIDFHDLPVFGREVSAYPLILLFEKSSADGESVTAARMEDLEFSSLDAAIARQSYDVEYGSLQEEGWTLAPPELMNVIEKLQEHGTPLQELVDDIFRGVLTGLNNAFVIDEDRRDAILDETPEADQFIVPVLKGDGVDRYLITPNGLYLIKIPSGWTSEQYDVETEDEAWDVLARDYPALADHLEPFADDARTRDDRGEFWWELRPCDYYDQFTRDKIVYPDISDGSSFALDEDGYYVTNNCYFMPTGSYGILGVLNSSLIAWYYTFMTSTYRGGYQRSFTSAIKNFPVTPDAESNDELADSAQRISELQSRLHGLNLNLLDYLAIPGDGPKGETLGAISTPASGVGDSILASKTDDVPKLRIADVAFEETRTGLQLLVTPEHKPGGQEDYIREDPVPAMEFQDITEADEELIRVFVPVAVEDELGDFKKTAAKTISLLSRLKDLKLPRLEDMEDDLQRYLDQKELAERLQTEIQDLESRINAEVFSLYGLSPDEVETVLDSLGTSATEKQQIMEKFQELTP